MTFKRTRPGSSDDFLTAGDPEDVARHAENAEAASAISEIITNGAIEFMRVRSAGGSASMNSALDYTGLKVIDRLRELGWTKRVRRG